MGYLRGSGVTGDYHEYGVCGANTFRIVLSEARMHGFDAMQFVAFDSFEGLPEVDSEVTLEEWKEGAMAMSEEKFWKKIRKHGVTVDRVRTVKGFFKDSLTDELQREFVDAGVKLAIANIDCDLKESSIPVFEFIEPLLQVGTLI